jgi:hypothetical protein
MIRRTYQRSNRYVDGTFEISTDVAVCICLGLLAVLVVWESRTKFG